MRTTVYCLRTENPSPLCSFPNTLSWIAKHWSREYREKTTHSRIIISCNLSSCRVDQNQDLLFFFHFQQFLLPGWKWIYNSPSLRYSKIFATFSIMIMVHKISLLGVPMILWSCAKDHQCVSISDTHLIISELIMYNCFQYAGWQKPVTFD